MSPTEKVKISVIQDQERRCAVCFKHASYFCKIDLNYEFVYICSECIRKAYLVAEGKK